MAFVSCCSFMMPAMAVDSVASGMELAEDMSAARYYAYMDLDTANESLKDDIIQARNTIIFSTSWVTEGVKGCVCDEDGTVIEELPQFYNIFPSDWEVPTALDNDSVNVIQPQQVAASSTEINAMYDDVVTLKQPTEGVVSPAFCKVATSWSNYNITRIDTTGYNGSSAKYNVPYTNTATSKSLGYENNLTSGQKFTLYPSKNITVGVHASSSTNPGDWNMQVYGYFDYS